MFSTSASCLIVQPKVWKRSRWVHEMNWTFEAYLLCRKEIGERDAGLSRGRTKPGANGEHGYSQDKQRPKKVKTYTEPSLLEDLALRLVQRRETTDLVCDRHPMGSILMVHPVSVFFEESIFFIISANCRNP